MKKIFTHFLPATILIIFPAVASAQLGGIGNLLGETDMIVRLAINVLMGVALLVFFWGLVKFISAQGSETSKIEAKKVMVWGLIALFVMVSVWGIVRFVQKAFLGGSDFSAPPVNII